MGHEHERGRPSSRYYQVCRGGCTYPSHRAHARSRRGHVHFLASTLVQVGMTFGRDSREATALNVDKFFGDVASQQARLRISAAVKFQRRTRASPGLASDGRDKGNRISPSSRHICQIVKREFSGLCICTLTEIALRLRRLSESGGVCDRSLLRLDCSLPSAPPFSAWPVPAKKFNPWAANLTIFKRET